MVKKKRIFDDSKIVKALVNQVCTIAPADNNKTYKIKLGKEILNLSGGYINRLCDVIIDNAELKSDRPEIRIIKKWRMQIELMKLRAANLFVNIDENMSKEEGWEIIQLGTFLGYGIVTEETIRLAEKYRLL